MISCKDCIQYDVCECADGLKYEDVESIKRDCPCFKNKADFVEIKTIRAWLYEIAINNVGCVLDGDFSNACEEIISRLDGLRNFAKERGN